MTREEIQHLADLARIRLSDAEVDSFAAEATSILEYVSQVNEIAAEEKPKEVGALYNVMREDVPTNEPGEYTEALLDAAPRREGRHIAVKKVLDNKKKKS